jgi:F-type H+-transporting ATPase subunit epsilon
VSDVPFDLIIVTPRGEAFRGPAESVVLPGTEGEFGVLTNHERFLTPLHIGEVVIRTAEGTLHGAITEGFAEVRGDEVTVLVESCELADQIDLARAELARERAEQELARLGPDEDVDNQRRLEAALRRALNRIAVARRRARA